MAIGFNLDQSVSDIACNSIGIGVNQNVSDGLLGYLQEQNIMGSNIIHSEVMNAMIRDIALIFYAIIGSGIVIACIMYLLYNSGIIQVDTYVTVRSAFKMMIICAIAFECADWILTQTINFADALTYMFGLNNDIMDFLIQGLTSGYSCIYSIAAAIGILFAFSFYYLREMILSSALLLFAIFLIFSIIGSFELPLSHLFKRIGQTILALILWSIFFTTITAMIYWIGMNLIINSNDTDMVKCIASIGVLYISILIPGLLFIVAVFNPVGPAKAVVKVVGSVAAV